jgi:hypothetical protein
LLPPPQIFESTKNSNEIVSLNIQLDSRPSNFELSIFFRFKLKSIEDDYINLNDILLRNGNDILSVLKLRINLKNNSFEIYHEGKSQASIDIPFELGTDIWFYFALGIDSSTGNAHIYFAEDSFQEDLTNDACNFINIGSDIFTSLDSRNGKVNLYFKTFKFYINLYSFKSPGSKVQFKWSHLQSSQTFWFFGKCPWLY